MTPQTLDRLLTDRALGELSPDVNELLDAWLQEHPTPASSEISATIDGARQVLRAPLPVGAGLRPARTSASSERNGPNEPKARPRQDTALSLPWLGLSITSACAACLVLGLLLGKTAKPEPLRVATVDKKPPPPAKVEWKSLSKLPELR